MIYTAHHKTNKLQFAYDDENAENSVEVDKLKVH